MQRLKLIMTATRKRIDAAAERLARWTPRLIAIFIVAQAAAIGWLAADLHTARGLLHKVLAQFSYTYIEPGAEYIQRTNPAECVHFPEAERAQRCAAWAQDLIWAVINVSIKHGQNPSIVLGKIGVESNFNARAKNKKSGASGPAQVMPLLWVPVLRDAGILSCPTCDADAASADCARRLFSWDEGVESGVFILSQYRGELCRYYGTCDPADDYPERVRERARRITGGLPWL